MKKVIAVVGMCGAGKSVICEYLEKKDFHKIYFGGITYKLMENEGIKRTPDSERIFRETLRQKYGRECYAKLIYPEIEENEDKYIVLDGLYSWYEYKYLKNKLKDNLVVMAIVCDKELRYERISKRKDRPFTKKEAKERDISEIENIYKGGPIAYADYYILNNSTFENVYESIDRILEDIDN